MKGELRLDLGGGNLHGWAELSVYANSESPPQRRDGGFSPGRFSVRIDLSGQFQGGPYAPLTGTAQLSGIFIDNANCQAQLRGTGTFKGNVSAPLGLAEITTEWLALEINGCGLMSPQHFAAALPAFTFSAPETIPTRQVGHLPSSVYPPVTAPSRPPSIGGPVLTTVMESGYALLKQGRFKEALATFEEVLRTEPSSIEALIGRGRALNGLGNLQEAIRTFEAVLKVRSSLAYLRAWLAELWLAGGDQGRARTLLEEELRLFPNSAWATSYLGTLYLLAGREKEAKQVMTTARRMDPRIVGQRYANGVALGASGQARRAAVEFSSVLRLDSNMSGAYFGLGMYLAQLGQRAQAIQAFKSYLRRDTSSEWARKAQAELVRLQAGRPVPNPAGHPPWLGRTCPEGTAAGLGGCLPLR
jgi:tetratricopeptide (TPR) repeat protein